LIEQGHAPLDAGAPVGVPMHLAQLEAQTPPRRPLALPVPSFELAQEHLRAQQESACAQMRMKLEQAQRERPFSAMRAAAGATAQAAVPVPSPAPMPSPAPSTLDDSLPVRYVTALPRLAATGSRPVPAASRAPPTPTSPSAPPAAGDASTAMAHCASKRAEAHGAAVEVGRRLPSESHSSAAHLASPREAHVASPRDKQGAGVANDAPSSLARARPVGSAHFRARGAAAPGAFSLAPAQQQHLLYLRSLSQQIAADAAKPNSLPAARTAAANAAAYDNAAAAAATIGWLEQL